LYIMF